LATLYLSNKLSINGRRQVEKHGKKDNSKSGNNKKEDYYKMDSGSMWELVAIRKHTKRGASD
jgi:hypothetical protein